MYTERAQIITKNNGIFSICEEFPVKIRFLTGGHALLREVTWSSTAAS